MTRPASGVACFGGRVARNWGLSMSAKLESKSLVERLLLTADAALLTASAYHTAESIVSLPVAWLRIYKQHDDQTGSERLKEYLASCIHKMMESLGKLSELLENAKTREALQFATDKAGVYDQCVAASYTEAAHLYLCTRVWFFALPTQGLDPWATTAIVATNRHLTVAHAKLTVKRVLATPQLSAALSSKVDLDSSALEGDLEAILSRFSKPIRVANFEIVKEIQRATQRVPPERLGRNDFDLNAEIIRLYDRVELKSPDTIADKQKKIGVLLPEDDDVTRLAMLMRKCDDPGATKRSIALEFTSGNEKDATRLLRQLQPSRYGQLLDGTRFGKS